VFFPRFWLFCSRIACRPIREWPEALRLEFDRSLPFTEGAVVPEVLDIQPGRLAPGRYLLRLEIAQMDSSPVGRATISFEIR
jgi:hypothetical protein